MARMYPREIKRSTTSGAERLLFEELRRQLPDEITVFHSVCWQDPPVDGRGLSRDREADFVILDPSRGILVLEVKGGQVWRDPDTGLYYSNEHLLEESPFEQAKANMYSLMQRVRTANTTARWAGSYRFEYAVAFPDCYLLPDMADVLPLPRHKVMDSTDLEDLGSWVRRALGRGDPSRQLEGEARAALVRLLSASSEPPPLGLLALIKAQNRRFEELTQSQRNILLAMSEYRRLAVAGCAGSGKTFLAMEQAYRLVSQGLRVLFTCHNRALADWVRESLSKTLGGLPDNLHVDEFDGVAIELCKRHGVSVPDPERLPEAQKTEFYRETLPELLDAALGHMPQEEKFDAVVVDEAQDFHVLRWEPLLGLLKDPGEGHLYIFYDSNQNLFVPEVDFPIPRPHLMLRQNCRNTQAIHSLAAKYHSDPDSLSCLGPEGLSPKVVECEPTAQLAALRREIIELREQGLSPSQIVVLTPRSSRHSDLKEGTDVGHGLRLTWGKPDSGHVAIRNIYAYKGLEADVAIVVEPHHIHREKLSQVLYVAFSRARHHLVVLGGLPEPRSS